MGSVTILKDRPLHPRRAMERICMLLREGDYEWSQHAEMRLRQRGLDNLDVEHILKYGRVAEPPSRPGSAWRYKIEGRCIDSKKMGAVVVEIEKTLVIVTVMI